MVGQSHHQVSLSRTSPPGNQRHSVPQNLPGPGGRGTMTFCRHPSAPSGESMRARPVRPAIVQSRARSPLERAPRLLPYRLCPGLPTHPAREHSTALRRQRCSIPGVKMPAGYRGGSPRVPPGRVLPSPGLPRPHRKPRAAVLRPPSRPFVHRFLKERKPSSRRPDSKCRKPPGSHSWLSRPNPPRKSVTEKTPLGTCRCAAGASIILMWTPSPAKRGACTPVSWPVQLLQRIFWPPTQPLASTSYPEGIPS